MPSRMRRLPAPDQCLIGGPLRATPRMRARTRIVGSSCTTLPTPEEGAAIESSRGRRRKPEHCRTCDSFTGRRQRGSVLTASGHKACFAAAGQRKSVAGAPSDIRLRLKLNGSFRPKLSLDVAYPSDSNQSEADTVCADDVLLLAVLASTPTAPSPESQTTNTTLPVFLRDSI